MRLVIEMNNRWLAVSLVALGLGVGWIAGHRRFVTVAHAQEQSSIIGSCSLTIPKEWGQYKGASDWGLAFEDSQGTLRFLRHTRCDITSGGSDSNPKANDWELMIRKR